MISDIPVSVIVVTRNEAHHIVRCLSALKDFDDIVVVDSHSDDDTAALAAAHGARVVDYHWGGQYPKKRQWCLDQLALKHDRVFFVDADEVVTTALVEEIRRLSWARDGYFIRGAYVFDEKVLRFGLMNNKLTLFDRRAFAFPIVDDLDAPGMGEIEGHYQPLPIKKGAQIGQLRPVLLHYAGDEGAAWAVRHARYAAWEAFMLRHHAYPPEIGTLRTLCKMVFRHMPWRPQMAFLHSFILKAGFMEGARGWRFAKTRSDYYRMVNDALSSPSKATAPQTATPTTPTVPEK